MNENNLREKEQQIKGKSIFGGFRLRFLLAVILFGAFIYCDRTNLSYKGQNADTVYQEIAENINIPILKKLIK